PIAKPISAGVAPCKSLPSKTKTGMTINRPSIRMAYTEARATTERFSSAFMLNHAGLNECRLQPEAARRALYQKPQDDGTTHNGMHPSNCQQFRRSLPKTI